MSQTAPMAQRSQRDGESLDLHPESLWRHDRLASLGLVTAGLVHELQNQVGGLLLFAQSMDPGGRSGDDREALEEVEKAALRCRDMLRDVLEFVRHGGAVAAGARSPPTRCARAVGDAWAIAQLHCYEKNIELRSDVSAGLWVGMPSHQLVQVMLNLMLNAVSALRPDGGWIRVSAAAPELDRIVITVEDSGAGVPEGLRDELFTPFARGASETQGGTGLGLYVSRSLCRNAGGELNYRAEGLGRVSGFEMVLPRERPPES